MPEETLGKKAMISQPMRGLSEEEIITTRNRAIRNLKDKGYEIVNTLFDTETFEHMADARWLKTIYSMPLYFISKSLERMATCQAVYFVKGWDKARGCCIEHQAAESYGLEMLYEEDINKK